MRGHSDVSLGMITLSCFCVKYLESQLARYVVSTVYTHPSILNDIHKVTFVLRFVIAVLLPAQVMWDVIV